MSARPWLKFYPSEWRGDPRLRMCSIAARGLWMEMLCVMHEADPRGFLVVNGAPLNERQVANLAGVSVDEATGLLSEMESAGVFSRDDRGTIYSRRMVRETRRSAEGREHGLKGGNPALTHKDTDNPDQAERVKGQGNPYIASSLSDSDTTPTVQEEASTREADAAIPLALEAFNEVAEQAGWPKARMNDRRRKAIRRMLAEHGLEGWRNGLAKARGSPFLCGENDREWRADLDFLLRPQAFTKVLEGSYERSGQSGNGRRTGNAISESFARAVARRSGQGERQADADGGFRDDAGGTGGSQGPGRTIEGEIVAFPERH